MIRPTSRAMGEVPRKTRARPSQMGSPRHGVKAADGFRHLGVVFSAQERGFKSFPRRNRAPLARPDGEAFELHRDPGPAEYPRRQGAHRRGVHLPSAVRMAATAGSAGTFGPWPFCAKTCASLQVPLLQAHAACHAAIRTGKRPRPDFAPSPAKAPGAKNFRNTPFPQFCQSLQPPSSRGNSKPVWNATRDVGLKRSRITCASTTSTAATRRRPTRNRDGLKFDLPRAPAAFDHGGIHPHHPCLAHDPSRRANIIVAVWRDRHVNGINALQALDNSSTTATDRAGVELTPDKATNPFARATDQPPLQSQRDNPRRRPDR